MKNYIYLIGLALITVSCEDPINVDLDNAETQLVVDAWLDNVSERQVIRLSETLPYFTNEFTPGLENAEVTIQTSAGKEFNFIHESDGRYVAQLNQGQSLGEVGDTFDLRIRIDNDILSAQTVMNRAPTIDSLVQEFRENEVFTDDGIYCQFFARDFIGLGDVYWVKTYKNGNYLNQPWEINIAYDAGFDAGGEVDGIVFIYPIRDLVNETDDVGVPIAYLPGDEVRVEIHSLSLDAFAFMEIMRDQLLNSFNTIFAEPLANTRGNITYESGEKTALGVFNVAAVTTAVKVIE